MRREVCPSLPSGGKSARSAIALLVDLELALAGAELRGAAPVQRLVPVLHGAVLVVDGFREAEDLLGLTGVRYALRRISTTAALNPFCSPCSSYAPLRIIAARESLRAHLLRRTRHGYH